MFAGVYEDGATVKLPEDRVAELLNEEGMSEFRPMEKHTMKNWVLIRREAPEDFTGDKALFEEALEYVFVLSKEKKK